VQRNREGPGSRWHVSSRPLTWIGRPSVQVPIDLNFLQVRSDLCQSFSCAAHLDDSLQRPASLSSYHTRATNRTDLASKIKRIAFRAISVCLNIGPPQALTFKKLQSFLYLLLPLYTISIQNLASTASLLTEPRNRTNNGSRLFRISRFDIPVCHPNSEAQPRPASHSSIATSGSFAGTSSRVLSRQVHPNHGAIAT
jgi:hypothetical protein